MKRYTIMTEDRADLKLILDNYLGGYSMRNELCVSRGIAKTVTRIEVIAVSLEEMDDVKYCLPSLTEALGYIAVVEEDIKVSLLSPEE